MQGRWAHFRAGLVLFAGFSMAVLATPGLDQLDNDDFLSAKDRAKARKSWVGHLLIAGADLNRAVRLPLVRWLAPLQRPLRIAQSWALYGLGPKKVKRFEIRADGQLVYRSNDRQARWLAPVLRYRRIRPIVSSICGKRSKSDEELVRFIARRAEDELGAASVEVVCTVSPWPGLTPREALKLRATAPDWEVETW